MFFAPLAADRASPSLTVHTGKSPNSYIWLATPVQAELPVFQEPAVVRAFEVACHAYGSRQQQDGQPLLLHAVATARILGEMGLDADVVAAGLLQVSLTPDTAASAG